MFSRCRKPSSKTRNFRSPRSKRRAITRRFPARRPTTASRSSRGSRSAMSCTASTASTIRSGASSARPSATCASSISTSSTARRSAREKYAYKLDWLAKVGGIPRRGNRAAIRASSVMGDFNIAPDDRDVHDPGRMARTGALLDARARRTEAPARRRPRRQFPPVQRRRRTLQLVGLPSGRFSPQSWPSHRPDPRRAMHCASACRAASIDREPRTWERASDHTRPVSLELADGSR